MVLNPWLCSFIVGLALIGTVTVVRGVSKIWKKAVDTANDLAATLRDATEIARAYREDLGALRTIAQASMSQNLGDEPESIIPRQEHPVVTGMPAPFWDRFPIKPKEEDAPPETAGSVDVTANEDELAEQERNEQAVDLETQERQKAATREADQRRLREMAEQSSDTEEK